MSRWSQQRRRGGPHSIGQLGGLAAAAWSLTVISTTAIDVVFTDSVPASAQGLLARYRTTTPVGAWSAAAGATSPVHLTGLTTATEYEVQVAWAYGGFPVSGWSASKLATTL